MSGVSAFVCALGACGGPGGLVGSMAVSHAPKKPSRIATTGEPAAAKAMFREALLDGAYERLDDVTNRLTAAYLKFPYDPELALCIAQAHLWRLSERTRDERIANDARVTDEITIAAYYFEQARRLSPDDRRLPGWIGAMELSQGTVHNEQVFIRRGYYRLRDAVEAYPEFNGFTLGFTMSGADAKDERFAEALAYMWKSAAACSGDSVTPAQPDSRDAIVGGRPTNPDPACWNSEKAPHNFEGFWWTLGLMELKAGHVEIGRAALNNARLSPTFNAWRYRERLERDIREADALSAALVAGDATAESRMIFGSSVSCVACHAR